MNAAENRRVVTLNPQLVAGELLDLLQDHVAQRSDYSPGRVPRQARLSVDETDQQVRVCFTWSDDQMEEEQVAKKATWARERERLSQKRDQLVDEAVKEVLS
jgi:hypothetical protein